MQGMLFGALLARLRSPVADSDRDADSVALDSRACADLVEKHYDFIWRLLARMGVRREDVDDATQQVFLVTASKENLQIKKGSERSFLFGVALRVKKEFAKRQARAQLHDDAALDLLLSSSAPDEHAERRQAWEALQTILAQMNEEVRAVFVMYEFEGMTAPEIAEVMGSPLGTVASRLKRGRELFHMHVQQISNQTEARVGG